MPVNVAIKIESIIQKEMGASEGSALLNKICAKMGTSKQKLEARDIIRVANYIMRDARSIIGYENATKLGKEIQRYKMVMEFDNLKDAKDDSSIRRKVDVLTSLGNLCYSADESDKALDYYDFAVKLSQRIRYVIKQAEAYRGMGHVYKTERKWENAVRYFQKGLDISMKINDAQGLADAYAGLGYVYWKKGDFSKALDQYQKSLEIATKIRNRALLATIYIEHGNVFNEQGELNKAIEYYNNSLRVLDLEKDDASMARVYNNIGDVYMQKKEWKNALKYFELCIEVGGQISHLKMEGWAIMNSAEVYAKMGEFDNSIKTCDRAVEILNKIDDMEGLCTTYRNYAMAYRGKKDYAKAKEYAEKSLKMTKHMNRPFMVADISLECGLIEKELGNDYEAKEYFQNALNIFEDIGAKRWAEDVKKAMDEIK